MHFVFKALQELLEIKFSEKVAIKKLWYSKNDVYLLLFISILIVFMVIPTYVNFCILKVTSS